MSNFLARLAMRNTTELRDTSGFGALAMPRLGSSFERKTDFMAGNDQGNEADEVVKPSFTPVANPDNKVESLSPRSQQAQQTPWSTKNSGSDPQTTVEEVHVSQSNKEPKFQRTVSAAPDDGAQNIGEELQPGFDKHVITSHDSITTQGQPAQETADTKSLPGTTGKHASDQIQTKLRQNALQERSQLSKPPQLRQTSRLPVFTPVPEPIIKGPGNNDKNIATPDSMETTLSSPLQEGKPTRADTRKYDHSVDVPLSTNRPAKHVKKYTDSRNESENKINIPNEYSKAISAHTADNLQHMKRTNDILMATVITSDNTSQLTRAETSTSSKQLAGTIGMNKADTLPPVVSVQGDKPNRYRTDFANEYSMPESSSMNGQGSATLPMIKVSIGRIEIRAATPPPVPAVAAPRPHRGPAVSLIDYLKKSKGRK